MGGRTDFRLVELSTTALQGLRVLHRHQRSTHPHLDDRPDGSPTGPLTPFFNTLLEVRTVDSRETSANCHQAVVKWIAQANSHFSSRRGRHHESPAAAPELWRFVDGRF